MSVSFYKDSWEKNEWQPEIAGVDFRERLASFMGQSALAGVEIYTAWVDVADDDTGEGYTEQITQDNCRIAISYTENDADCILYQDRRDERWFRFTRLAHPDNFERLVTILNPWATCIQTMVPIETNYAAMLKQMTTDVDSWEVPDEWLDA